MKNIFTLLTLFSVAFSVISCEEADDTFTGNGEGGDGTEQGGSTTPTPTPTPSINYTSASGDEIVLGSYTNWAGEAFEGVYISTDELYDGVVIFGSNDNQAGYIAGYSASSGGYWYNFAVSTNFATEVEVESEAGDANYAYEFSAYASTDADGDGAFALCYYSSWDGSPTIVFNEPKNLSTISVAPASILASYCKRSESYDYYTDVTTPITDYTFTVYITGYNAADEVVASTSANLADEDFNINAEWLAVNLASFDDVSYITFAASCNDDYAPFYFCVDALVFE
ncbi:MAG: hypothetical protein R3Y68_00355 [Rikenellaceae bacterium]